MTVREQCFGCLCLSIVVGVLTSSPLYAVIAFVVLTIVASLKGSRRDTPR